MKPEYFYILQLIIVVSLASCNSSVGHADDADIGIIINKGISNQIDLKRKEYKVYHINNGDDSAVVKFELTRNEDSLIKKKFYDASLDQTIGSKYIADHCAIMPKIITTIVILKETKESSIIEIDRNCKRFAWKNRSKARKILSFLDLVDRILLQKKEVKNAVQSGVIYM